MRAVWASQFAAKIGSSFVNPFIAIYLSTDLHIHGRSLATWAGVVAGASGVGTALAGPLWGHLADRRGRKPMLIRALLGGALSLFLMGLTRSPWQLVALRFTQGAMGGTSSAATALVTSDTPRSQLANALGTLSSAATLASAIAPLLGGIGAATIGLRYGFFISAGLVLISAVPVILAVRETRRYPAAPQPQPRRSTTRGALVEQLLSARVLRVLLSQLLLNFGFFSVQQLVVVRLLDLLPSTAAGLATGAGFAASALAATLTAVTYPRLHRRYPFPRLTAVAAAALAAGAATCGLAPSAWGILVGLLVVGSAYGGLSPLLAAMLGLAAPAESQARIFGFSASSLAIGLAVGPPISGLVATATNPTVGLLLAGFALIVPTGLLTVRRRADASGNSSGRASPP